VVIHNVSIDNLDTHRRKQDALCAILKLSVNGASTIFGPVSRVTNTRFSSDYT